MKEGEMKEGDTLPVEDRPTYMTRSLRSEESES